MINIIITHTIIINIIITITITITIAIVIIIIVIKNTPKNIIIINNHNKNAEMLPHIGLTHLLQCLQCNDLSFGEMLLMKMPILNLNANDSANLNNIQEVLIRIEILKLIEHNETKTSDILPQMNWIIFR